MGYATLDRPVQRSNFQVPATHTPEVSLNAEKPSEWAVRATWQAAVAITRQRRRNYFASGTRRLP
ncbi:MAG: hypothetical protein FJW38_30145 [Acidobacteria bacterium]|nr:hypothetical protein [Acidobacteriota bacterium]